MQTIRQTLGVMRQPRRRSTLASGRLRAAGNVCVRIAALCCFCILLGGCGQIRKVLPQPPLRPVSVSLIQLAQQTPAWSAVLQLDQASFSGKASPIGVEMPALPVAPLQSPLSLPAKAGTMARHGSGNVPAGAARTQLALAQAESHAVGNVRARLARESNQLIGSYRALQQAQVTVGVAQARQQAIERYNDTLQSLLTPVAAQRINLNVQIAALTKDALPINPPTAPDDYWGKLLAERQAALNRLPPPQTIAQRAALEQISAQVATARLALQQAADAQVASYAASLASRNGQIISRQAAAFQREQSDLLTITTQLNTQLSQPLRNSVDAQGTMNASSDVALANLGAINRHNPEAANAQNAANGQRSPDGFALQRQRLIEQLLDSTRRSAAHAASQLHFRIVDWNAGKPDQHAMSLLAARMKVNASIGA